MAEEVVEAVSNFEDLERSHSGPVDLTDVVTVGYLLAAFKDHPETIELNMHDVAACKRMQIDRAAYEQLIDESEHEIDTPSDRRWAPEARTHEPRTANLHDERCAQR